MFKIKVFKNNLLPILGLVLIFIACLFKPTESVNDNYYETKKSKNTQLFNIADYKIKQFSSETFNFIIKRPELVKNYNSNKYLVFYTEELKSTDCPFATIFGNAFFNAVSNPNNSVYFSFNSKPDGYTGIKSRETDLYVDFLTSCNIVCIINPKNNHIISFDSVGKKDAKTFQQLLDYIIRNGF